MRKGQPFFTLQQLFIRYFRTAKVHKYVMKCAHFPWSQESNITEWRVCSGRPTSCVYLEAYSPLPPPVMVRRHTVHWAGTSAVGRPPATDIDIMDPAMYFLFSTSDFYRLLGMYNLQSLCTMYFHIHIDIFIT